MRTQFKNGSEANHFLKKEIEKRFTNLRGRGEGEPAMEGRGVQRFIASAKKNQVLFSLRGAATYQKRGEKRYELWEGNPHHGAAA